MLGVLLAIIAFLGGWTVFIAVIYLIYKMSRNAADRGTSLSPSVATEIQGLREEMERLRETTTRFDMSFDAAISRMEQRMGRIEGQAAQTAPMETPATVTIAPAEAAPQEVQVENRY